MRVIQFGWRGSSEAEPECHLSCRDVPYCDQLSRLMSAYPTYRAARSLRDWLVIQMTPASTMHYFLSETDLRNRLAHTKIYMPLLLIFLLLMLKPVDWSYKLFLWIRD